MSSLALTPGLLLPIAPAAYGKSTLARKLQEDNSSLRVVSTDALRAELCPESPCRCFNAQEGCMGRETCQCRNAKAFYLAKQRIDGFLKDNYSVFFDGTNLSAKTRKSEIIRAKENDFHVTALLARPLSLEELLRRNSSRGRVVPQYVIERMLTQHKSLTPASLLLEGFSKVLLWDDFSTFSWE